MLPLKDAAGEDLPTLPPHELKGSST